MSIFFIFIIKNKNLIVFLYRFEMPKIFEIFQHKIDEIEAHLTDTENVNII